jgi:hypothetical protein
MPGARRGGASPVAPHTSTPQELKERLNAERAGTPHLIFRDAEGHQVIWPLAPAKQPVTIGRREECDISLEWDAEVSRVHAQLQIVGQEWTVVDDGLSRNGSFVNTERLQGRRRLRDGDELLVGGTAILFRAPAPEGGFTTRPGTRDSIIESLTAEDRRVLIALCRPFKEESHMLPASNVAIAEELCLSIPAVKKRLSALFVRFEIQDLPQSEKRTRLAVEALQRGIVQLRDL